MKVFGGTEALAALQQRGDPLVRLEAKTRVRVEHVFAIIANCIKATYLRYIGLKRITAVVAQANLLHNARRVGQLLALGARIA